MCETWRRDGSLPLVRERVAGGKCACTKHGKELGEGTLIVVGVDAKDPRKITFWWPVSQQRDHLQDDLEHVEAAIWNSARMHIFDLTLDDDSDVLSVCLQETEAEKVGKHQTHKT